MRYWIERFEAMAAAVSFAECGEWDTASTLEKKSASKRSDDTAKVAKRPDRRVRATAYHA